MIFSVVGALGALTESEYVPETDTRTIAVFDSDRLPNTTVGA